MTIRIRWEDILATLLFAWLTFTASFIYIGVTHLETISRCLVIQTELMVKASAPTTPTLQFEMPSIPEAPSTLEVPADPRRGDRI